ncbi:zinc finger domain-containing protein [Actinoplanes rectilineatus]|uniref:zinc finger domain-containing protein n=1 Tax=Actinoplanes rectilineatus TaxID=113571 RepID=UPI0005F2A037|nr:hypothetical protein [Actinoplanes rectilineatus]
MTALALAAPVESFDLIDVLRAPLAVTCPKCNARPGHECESTGGGNRAFVATHKARENRVSGWPEEFAAEAGRLVKSVLRASWEQRAAVDWSKFEAAAAPAPAAKPLTPKGVRLSETQAEEIERYVLRGGHGWVSTVHFHGDALHRATVNALESKGIVEAVADSEDGYGRNMKLTGFGWKVYDQHRLIIKRLTDAEIAERVARAESGRCLICGEQPGVTVGCEPCDLERFAVGAGLRGGEGGSW